MDEQNISWNLSAIFPSIKDPSLEQAIKDVTTTCDILEKKYQGKIKTFTSKQLVQFLKEYEDHLANINQIQIMANLSFSANMALFETQQLNDRVTKLLATLGKKLAFIQLDLGKLVHEKPKIISDPLLSNYKHYLEKLQRNVPHQLTEIEEQLIIEKDQFGIRGWQQLQSKWLNTRMFEVLVEGKKKLLSYGEANGLLTHPDRATRESANKAIYELLGKDGEIFSSALRNICNDWLAICERRKYVSHMHASLIANDCEQKTIAALLTTIDDNTVIYRRYLKLKAKIMGLPKLGNYDIMAPYPGAANITYHYTKAKEVIINAYENFDKEYAYAVQDMFEKNHIDASPRYGKRNGAFCTSFFKGKTAFILQSFADSLDDVYTLAHELGHATHGYYFEQSQTFLNISIPMIVAETASIMGELLLTDYLLKMANNKKEKIAILMTVLDGAGMAAFQVTARVWFEQALYDAIKRGEFLDHKAICTYWTTSRDRIYGDVIDWLKEMDSEWTMKPHYYLANFRFYNYPYVYAQLFVYALYQKYLEEGKAFIPKFKQVLSVGSSLSPETISKNLGLDVTSPTFWKLGIKRFEYFVNELEKLIK